MGSNLGKEKAGCEGVLDIENFATLSKHEQLLIIIASRAAILLDHPELCMIPWWDQRDRLDKKLHAYHLEENIKILYEETKPVSI